MRSKSFVLSCVALLAGGMNLLVAQQGGSHGSSHAGGIHVSNGSYAGGGNRAGSVNTTGQLTYPTPIGLQRTYSGYTGINRGAIPENSGRGRERGYVGGAGFLFAAPYYSTFDNYSAPYANYDSSQDQSGQNAAVSANLLGEQVQRLSSEVEALRRERESSSSAPMAGPIYYRPAATPEDEAPTTPPVTLVLTSGKQVQLKSYAVMGREIWDFTAQPVKKIAVASVNLTASKALTEANGAEFPDIR